MVIFNHEERRRGTRNDDVAVRPSIVRFPSRTRQRVIPERRIRNLSSCCWCWSTTSNVLTRFGGVLIGNVWTWRRRLLRSRWSQAIHSLWRS